MTTKPPTPQGISRLLRKAGFERSNYGDRGIAWSGATTGYTVWRTYHHDNPAHPYVAVAHVVKGAYGTGPGEEWDAYLADATAKLGEYAGAIRAAGYAPVVRDRSPEPPWLTILTVAGG